MKNTVLAAALCGALLFSASADASGAPEGPYPVASAKVFFSPEQSGEAAIVALIDKAEKQVLVQAFHFHNSRIAKALIDAKTRGAEVRVILDKSHRTATKSSAHMLEEGGVPVYVDDIHKTAHNKIIVVDGRYVETGSYNYNGNAEKRNAENLLILDSPELASKYLENWKRHLEHSKPFDR